MKHYIIVKFNEAVDVNMLINPIKDLFNKALDIEGVLEININVSNTKLPNRHDLMIEMLLNREGLKNFDSSNIHQVWKSEYGKYIIDKAIFDCD